MGVDGHKWPGKVVKMPWWVVWGTGQSMEEP